MEERYFAASNSSRGFISYFDKIFDPSRFEHIYIIKGGPGTGKNYFMRTIAEVAENKGKKVICYYCSSDQNSLDGIVIDDKIAVIDGTSPHDADADIPGAVQDIVDLGVFWDIGALSEKRELITKINAEKKKHYSRAYKYLAAYHEISEAAERLTTPIIDLKKIRKSVQSIMNSVKNGETYIQKIALCDSVGMEGRVRFDSFDIKAKKIYRIGDLFDTANIYLSVVAETAKVKNLSVTLSYDPINSDKLDAVFLDDEKILFSARGDRENAALTKNISMARFLPSCELSKVRSSLKKAMKLRELMLEETMLALSDVKEEHFRLESIYKSAMDFEKKEKFTEDFIKKLFG